MTAANSTNTPTGQSPSDLKVDELPVGTILAGRFKLTELVQSHPLLGLTYNAINQEGQGFVVRVDAEKNALSFVRSEAGFLQALMHGAKHQTVIYFVTRYRPGPTLNQCLGAMSDGKFKVGTAARVAHHIIKAIQIVHALNYLLRRIDPNVIRFDVRSRSIYLSDLSSVRVDPIKMKINAIVRWSGAQLYAPMQHHNGGSISTRHDVEAAVFLLVDMTTAKLPWESTPTDQMGPVKRKAVTDQSLFNGCPAQYAAIYTYVSCLTDADKLDYDSIFKKLEEAWKQAGVKDAENDKYDWESVMRAPDQHGY
ncbi:hypothetical protein M3Y98_01050300 [Aphelenchoides besseyi]|nr:hypothetical protein M3Y98_01050300 [Aphelenchoides besseyi]KAI6209802.1 hypothetical protein M3Y96_00259700 [Aphelenchoides besseyi]